MTIRNIACTTALAALTFIAGAGIQPAFADDTEVFFTVPTGTGGKANVLFMLDTSQSMYTEELTGASAPYDRSQTYAGSCDSNAYYWTDGTAPTKNDILDCSSNAVAKLTAAQFDCPSTKAGVDAEGTKNFDGKVAQYVKTTGPIDKRWATLSQKSVLTVCQGDIGVGSTAGLVWASIPKKAYTLYDGNYINYSNCCKNAKKKRIDMVREAVGKLFSTTDGIKVGLMRFGYDGDVVWEPEVNSPGGGIQCQVTPNPVEDSRSSNGAPIVFPVTDLDGPRVAAKSDGTKTVDFKGDTVREQLRYQLGVDAKNTAQGWIVDKNTPAKDQPFQVVENKGKCPLPLFNPGGRSPIGGAMLEAYYYFNGAKWSQKFGEQAALGSGYQYPSVPQSRNGDTYVSPIQDGCSKNFIVLLSDGTTEQDNEVDNLIEKLQAENDDGQTFDFDEVIYTQAERDKGAKGCDKDDLANGNPPPSMCVDDIAEFMFKSDVRPKSKCAKCTGMNNVTTYTIGFKLGKDPAGVKARQLLSDTAKRGGGEFYQADSAAALEDAFNDITRRILTDNTSFTAPAVTVNAFNRTQNLNDLYMSLFRPSFDYRWRGNVKKYELKPTGEIIDANGKEAVDPTTGFFRDTAQDIWSGEQDGEDITKGGAASHIDPAERAKHLFTNLTGESNVALSNGSNDVEDLRTADAASAKTLLGIQGGDLIDPSDSGSAALTVDHLVSWLQGMDPGDLNGDGSETDARLDMGDPLHSRPQTVIYSGTADNPDAEATLFVITNDGFLHAIDPDSGDEHWAFIPKILLKRTRDLYYNESLAYPPEEREYALDGNIRVLRIDNDGDGKIEPDDKAGERDRVYIFFGQRRGGSIYFALDVSYKTNPKLLWAKSFGTDPGQSWSTPVPARVRIGAEERRVIIFGGGYDEKQDQISYREDAVGRGIYMADALTGELLWHAGPAGSSANLVLPDMKFSIPGDIRVVDLTGDGFADRMYAADLGGQVWRFDIFNGNPVGSDATEEGKRLVEGGLLASLGEAGEGAFALDNSIRFFSAPDPAIIKSNGVSFINVAIGSGHREKPLETVVTNWFFSIRDYNPFQVLYESQYQTDCGEKTPCHQIVTEDDLADLTKIVGTDATAEVPVVDIVDANGNVTTPRSAGWKIEMTDSGEKVLAESRTFPVRPLPGGPIVTTVIFTSFTPTARCPEGYVYDKALGDCVNADDKEDRLCGVGYGLNRLYAVSVTDARPVRFLKDGEATTDRVSTLAQGSIAPEVVLVFPTPDANPEDPNGPRPAVPPVCLVGLEGCGMSIANPPVRTYWRQRGAN